MGRILIVADQIAGNPYARMFIDALREGHEVICVAKGCHGERIDSAGRLQELYERPILQGSRKARKTRKERCGRSRLGNLLRAARKVRRVKRDARRDARFFDTLGAFDCILCVNSARLLGCLRHRRRHGGTLVPCLFEIWPNQRANYPRELSRGLAGIERACLGEADKVIVPHRSWWRLVRLRYGLRGKRWAEVPNVARDDHPEFRPEKTRKRGGFSLYYQGRFATGRGLELVMRAVGEVEGITLGLRGAGGAEDALRRLAVETGAPERIRFLEPLPPGELVDSCKHFDVGLISLIKDSGNGKFGIGSKFFEYIVAGIAVLVPDTWPLKDWVTRYDVGRVYRAGDEHSLRQVLQEMADAPEQIELWARNATRAAQTDFHYEHVCEMVRAEVEPLVGGA